LSSPTPKVKEALQQPSPPIETEAPKDKEASSPYDPIQEDLALYKTKTRSDPMDQFFVAIKNLNIPWN
jgi:hypothetical protein